MTVRPTVLCPVDFSDGSRAALRCAVLVAEHFGSRLIVLAVEDPLLTEAVDLGTGVVWDAEETRRELAHFARRAIGETPLKTADVHYEVAVGKPAREILHLAHERGCDLIVMSTHGLTGMRKLFFGSTTERVLRETTIPVLATPPAFDVPRDFEELQRVVRRILVPVDMTSASAHTVTIGREIAETLKVPLLLTHVVEPIRSPLAARLHLASVDNERRTRAEDALNALLKPMPPDLHAEALVVYGDPAEEIAKLARDRQAGLIVINLHGSPMLGPRMGSVTYRVLCLASALVLALPSAPAAASAGKPASKATSLVHK